MSTFPTAIKNFTQLQDGVDTVKALHQNERGDEITAIETALGTNLSNLKVQQIVNYQTGAMATGTTAIPNDDTIPQITEGTEFMTLAITPKLITSKLKIDVILQFSPGGADQSILALFKDSIADALAVVEQWRPGAGDSGVSTLALSHYITAGTTSAITFRVRAGGQSGTFTFNGSGGSRKMGGVYASSITITEYVP
jgi:hypothetical protein